FSEHRLTGQPDYIMNGGISLLAFNNSFEFTASYNKTGDFINELGTSDLRIKVANGTHIPVIPHYRVRSRDMVDLVVSQSLLKNKCKLKFNVINLLKKRYIIYQDLNGNGKFDDPVVVKKQTDLSARDKTQNYLHGTDNTPISIDPQRAYSFSVSYTF